MYHFIFFAGLLIWMGETVYFGYNETAQSGAERLWDVISIALLAYGAIGGIVVAAAKTIGKNITVSNGDQNIKIVAELEKYHQARMAQNSAVRKSEEVKRLEAQMKEVMELFKEIKEYMEGDDEERPEGVRVEFGGDLPLPEDFKAIMSKIVGGICFTDGEAPEDMPEFFKLHWEEAHCEKHKTKECTPDTEKEMEEKLSKKPKTTKKAKK